MKQPSALSLFVPTSPQPDKPLMVLLPGLDGTGQLFAPQTSGLSRHFDLRCLSIPEDNRQDWPALAKSVIGLIQDEQAGRITYLCGESYGGCLGLQIALAAPTTVNQLVLINPASSLRGQFWSRWLLPAAPYAPEWVYKLSGAFTFYLLADFERIQNRWQQLFVETVRPISQSCVNWRLSMLQSFEIDTAQLKRLTMPTVLLASGRDRLLPSYREARRLQQFLADATTYLLPESGHVCLLEDSVDLASCLKALDFLPEPSSIKV
ncbi:MAG: alpha/beta fold hydrolase [Leptolyngbyaceae cyanobacterium]